MKIKDKEVNEMLKEEVRLKITERIIKVTQRQNYNFPSKLRVQGLNKMLKFYMLKK